MVLGWYTSGTLTSALSGFGINGVTNSLHIMEHLAMHQNNKYINFYHLC